MACGSLSDALSKWKARSSSRIDQMQHMHEQGKQRHDGPWSFQRSVPHHCSNTPPESALISLMTQQLKCVQAAATSTQSMSFPRPPLPDTRGQSLRPGDSIAGPLGKKKICQTFRSCALNARHFKARQLHHQHQNHHPHHPQPRTRF